VTHGERASVGRLCCGDRILDLAQTRVMGIVNVTPDSFSDGGRYFSAAGPRLERIIRRVERMQRDGAALVDVGGESTRPGAGSVTEAEELERVLPVVEAIAARFDLVISVDTSSPLLMRECIARGAGMINDVRALRRPGALEAVAASSAAVCLMHMRGEPQTMQDLPHYRNVCDEVSAFLYERAARCAAAGIGTGRIAIDPGFGFGKTLAHNLRLFNGLESLASGPYPVLVGVSRKSMIGQVLGKPVHRRVAGGVALATLAARAGAGIIRTHDVAATSDALRMVSALREQEGQL